MEETTYSEIGRMLRTARQERRLSIQQASQEIHIRLRYLEALESGDFANLPGLAYVRGYLQKYASYLALDKDELLRRFDLGDESLARKTFYLPQTLRAEKTPRSYMVSGALGAALAIYLIWHFAVRSGAGDISPVEPYPAQVQAEIPEIVEIIPSITSKQACLRGQVVLYPPCTAVQGQGFSPSAIPGQAHSIVENPSWNWRIK